MRTPSRPKALAAIAVVIIAAGAGTAAALALSGGPATARRNSKLIAVVQQQRLELLDAASGKVVHHLLGGVGTVSLSPDGREVYAERTNGRLDPFTIDRVPAAGGPVTRLAAGEEPTVSPDGRELAYEAGDGHALVVRTLATGRRRTIELASLIGPGASFNNTPSPLVWLSGHQLLAVPLEDAVPVSTDASGRSPVGPPGSCPAVYARHRECAIVVDLDAVQPAHAVGLDLPTGSPIESVGAGPAAGQLLVGGGVRQPVILRFVVTDTTARRVGAMTVPGAPLIVGFSPSGRQVLYLRGHGPVQLWVGRLTPTAVAPTVELLARADLGTVSW